MESADASLGDSRHSPLRRLRSTEAPLPIAEDNLNVAGMPRNMWARPFEAHLPAVPGPALTSHLSLPSAADSPWASHHATDTRGCERASLCRGRGKRGEGRWKQKQVKVGTLGKAVASNRCH